MSSTPDTPGSWVLQLPKGIGDRKRIDTASFAAKNSIGWVDLVDPAKVSKYSHLEEVQVAAQAQPGPSVAGGHHTSKG